MVYGYIRVSSDTQTVENQRFEISNFCKKQGLEIDGWIEETVSGGIDYNKRKLGKLLKHLKEGDMLICSEISRLGRSLFMIMEILNFCMEKNCKVWTIKDGYRLGDDIQSKVLAFAFGLSAEIERKLIQQRTKEALARLKSQGVILGARAGVRRRLNPKCAAKHDWIVSKLKEGVEKNTIAKKLKISPTTLYRYLVYTNQFVPVNCKKKDWVENGIFH